MNYATPTQEYARDEDRAFISNKAFLPYLTMGVESLSI